MFHHTSVPVCVSLLLPVFFVSSPTLLLFHSSLPALVQLSHLSIHQRHISQHDRYNNKSMSDGKLCANILFAIMQSDSQPAKDINAFICL